MKGRLSLQARVLLPIFVILVALVGFMFWMISRHFVTEVESQARQALETADAAFAYYQEAETRDFKSRYGNIETDNRLRQVLQRDDPKTLEFLLKELIADFGADAAIFNSSEGRPSVGVQGRDLTPWTDIEKAAAPAVAQALRGEFNISTVSAAGKLWEVVSVPVSVSDHTGVLTFAHSISESLLKQIKRLTHSEILFVADGKVVASTVSGSENDERWMSLFTRVFETNETVPQKHRHIESVRVGDEHFIALAGPLIGLNNNQKLGYLLLYSSQRAWEELRSNQMRLVFASFASIVLSCGLVWLLVRHVMRPLELLRKGAEEVGRGDFSHQVPITSKDEVGELAATFNQMTNNLRVSRADLEQTVERLKTTQAQLVQTEKLAAVGEFVAGVTHELNNPLTAVIGFAQLLKESEGISEENKEYVGRIIDGSDRCHKIVRSLLSFARKHRPERKLSELNELVENTLNFVQYEFRTSNIQIVRKLAPNLPETLLDPNQLQQVFLNLVQNARQAIEGFRRDGRLEVTTEKIGNRLRVTFSDNGPGIKPENLVKIFDPFFTTKEVGKGTGLGLSLSYGIVQEHGGTIEVKSNLGEGAQFIIELPIVSDGTEGTHVDGVEIASKGPVLRGVGRRVLVIDDEEPVLELARATLARRGFSVDTATCGNDGLKQTAIHNYDLILCDWKMPGLDGQQVFEQLQMTNPVAAKRFVFMTGDVINERTQKVLRESGAPCLAKPFSIDEFEGLMKNLTSGN